jgi:CO/xanthine dehydrogenase FAD-binding subunit
MAPSTLLRSRKLIPSFAVHGPATAAEAVALKASRPGAAYIAGGIDVVDRLKHGDGPTDLIRLDRIASLAGD